MNVLSELQHLEVDQLKETQRKLNIRAAICMFNVRTSGNVGMAIRTACTMGFSDFIICGRRHYDRRFTVGGHNYIDISYFPGVEVDLGTSVEKITYFPEEFAEKCISDNWIPVFIEQGGEDIRDIIFGENSLLIFGNESIGIPKTFMDSVKFLIPKSKVVSIPQWSILRSMNVTHAATIAMWHLRTKNYKNE
jgi:tRNA(Leu) C34 or U34 (ribose-2'-O)-methylase TrmL